jgi:hypothetical protein
VIKTIIFSILINYDTECLVAGAASANTDKNIGDGFDDTNELPLAITVQTPSEPLTITIPTLNFATLLTVR